MKKLIAAILAVIMLAGLTACISEDPGKLLADDTKLTIGEYLYKTDYIGKIFGWLASLFK